MSYPVGLLSRRRLLGLAVGLPVLAACSVPTPVVEDPTGTPTPAGGAPSPATAPTSAPPPPVAGAQSAAITELGLAELAGAVLTGPRRTQLNADQRRLLGFLAEAHRAHAAALDPSATAPRPADITGLSRPQALARLSRSQSAAAILHRSAALAARGADALRFGSLVAAAGLYAGAVAGGRAVPTGSVARTPPDLPIIPDTAAAQSLVAQLHAVIYGYQLATGRMAVAGRRDDQAVAELRGHRIRRDRLIGWLRRRGAEVPVPEPAYRPSVEVRDGATGARLVRSMLVALQPHAGVWLAAAADPEREWALDFFLTTADLARGWGAPLHAWPGAPD